MLILVVIKMVIVWFVPLVFHYKLVVIVQDLIKLVLVVVLVQIVQHVVLTLLNVQVVHMEHILMVIFVQVVLNNVQIV